MSGASRVKSTGLGFVVILTNVLIVALVAIGFSQRGFSGWWDTLRGDWEPPVVSDPFAEDEVVATTEPPVEDDEVVTAPPSPGPAATEPEPSVRERYEDGEDVSVLVLGDRTGTHENDWVAAWARALTVDREVELTSTLADDPTRYGDPAAFGGEGPAVSIDNASLIGGTPEYAAARLDLFVREDPDLVLVNFGRANTPEDLPEQLSDLQDELSQALPDAEVRYIVQPPRRDGQPAVTDSVREWAAETEAETIDVAQVFEDEEIVDLTVSGRDPLSVNIFGGQRWAEVVQEAVFGATATDGVEEDDGSQAGGSDGAAEGSGAAAEDDTAPGAAEPTQEPSAQPAPPAPVQPTADPTPWQPPVSPWFPPVDPTSDPEPTSPAPTGPTPGPVPTDPGPTAPAPTEPTPTDPDPTSPAPTDPDPTQPEPTGPDRAAPLSWWTVT